LIPIFTQSETAINAVAETVTTAIDSGLQGIAVLLIIVLIILGGGVVLLILRVIVPLLKQSIELTGQVTAMIQRTNTAIEHSNETNTLQTQATNFQTGVIQGVDKNIVGLGTQFENLSRNFGNYQTLQSDTISGFRLDLDAFKTEVITHVQQLMAISEANAKRHVTADSERVEIKAMLAEIITLVNNIKPPPVPATPPPTEINVTLKPSQPDAPPEAADLPKAS
jgi:hypothetical protein